MKARLGYLSNHKEYGGIWLQGGHLNTYTYLNIHQYEEQGSSYANSPRVMLLFFPPLNLLGNAPLQYVWNVGCIFQTHMHSNVLTPRLQQVRLLALSLPPCRARQICISWHLIRAQGEEYIMIVSETIYQTLIVLIGERDYLSPVCKEQPGGSRLARSVRVTASFQAYRKYKVFHLVRSQMWEVWTTPDKVNTHLFSFHAHLCTLLLYHSLPPPAPTSICFWMKPRKRSVASKEPVLRVFGLISPWETLR